MDMEIMNQPDAPGAMIEEPVEVRKYCHQCHQKRSNAVGNCVTKRRNTTCAVKYCRSCLWHRYQETPEEIASKDDWVCHKCDGTCNCSNCMKKTGKYPTKILARNVNPEDAVGEVNSAEENHAGCTEENAASRTKSFPPNKNEYQSVEVNLPQGIEPITVSSIDLPPQDAGNVLQFLEFCVTFEEALVLEKGQPQIIIHEIVSGRNTRSQENSMLTEMIIKLLTLIIGDKQENATDDMWFSVLGYCLAKSEVRLDDFPPEMFQKGIGEYEKMSSSQRLKLLNFLCDETLNTRDMRNFIVKRKILCDEKKKETKEKLKAAIAKETQLHQKIKYEFAKAKAENNGVELPIEQRIAIISEMDAESEQVFAEKQNALEMQKGQEYDDPHRTNPVELDDNGLILWKLKSYKEEEPNILLQDIGSWSDTCAQEKWFAFSPDQKPQVEKYISFKRKKSLLLEKKKGKTHKSQ